ncbi:MarR family winged helix-turn-helix transcriptional regulator [Labrenzia sp. PHM005]|uniref:MarR family winged helix-turn-helix transcriptional regulator n=1 Tax=Labrenzia sp. PHM005 TaxID=2590016 RepID=UPI0011406868|nr:MarR family transcriptional regulator [Labrenzia sp. PHM005]QDG76471.1 MarR family transcriptional regulator [Labrenzia sp. PHM005]
MLNPQRQSRLIADLIDRLGRLNAAEEWNGPLNPSQYAALAYLGRANKFSRAPSHVADYLATTRGTASQTLKALARKDLIAETRLPEDKRSIRYDLTLPGLKMLETQSAMEDAIAGLSMEKAIALQDGLSALVRQLLDQRGGKSFGLCKDCRHHQETASGQYCQLLEVTLKSSEINEICHEHAAKQEATT